MRGDPVLGFEHLEAGAFENGARPAARQTGIVYDENATFHKRSSMAAAMFSSVTLLSERPASTTLRGMP